MSVKHISSAILGVGVDDTTIDLFESQYPVPTGVSYNSYVILDEKTTILDTVDHRATEEWLANLSPRHWQAEKPGLPRRPPHGAGPRCQHCKAGGPLPGDERGGQRQDTSSIWISSSARRRLPKTAV